VTSYRRAGVDVHAAQRLVDSFASDVLRTWGRDVVGPFGSFAAGVRLPAGYRSPVLMMTMDGVGTKLELARRCGILEGVGFDLVAMCVDDLAAVGARSIGFCDYLAVGRIDETRDRRIVASIAAACLEAGCPLLGGETAEHPGVMQADRFDLAGAAFGVVEEERQITGGAILPGDLIIGLGSPNLRSNGFSLVRSLVAEGDLALPVPGTGRSAADVLLEPSVIYAPAVLEATLIAEVHGMAHITGGGLIRNLERILPAGSMALVEWGSWVVPPVFGWLRSLALLAEADMAEVFNMGIGFCLIVPPPSVEAVRSATAGHRPRIIGRIEPGSPSVRLA